MGNNKGFRAWFYFRNGWSMYFAFIFSAINTLTVTYYLAIERAPILESIFPSFIQYVIITTAIGVPLLILIGYIHWKKTAARRAEVDIAYETNPYQRRTLVNGEINLMLNLKLIKMVLKLIKNEKLTENEIIEVSKLENDFAALVNERTFSDTNDITFLRKVINKKYEKY